MELSLVLLMGAFALFCAFVGFVMTYEFPEVPGLLVLLFGGIGVYLLVCHLMNGDNSLNHIVPPMVTGLAIGWLMRRRKKS